MYRWFLRIMQNNGRNLKTLLLRFISLGKQDLQKIWQEELTSLTARVSIQFILLQRQKKMKAYDFITDYIRHKM